MGNSRQQQPKAPQKSWWHWELLSWDQGARPESLLPQERGRKGSTVTESQACYCHPYCRDRKGEDRNAVAGWGPPFTPSSKHCPGSLCSCASHCSHEHQAWQSPGTVWTMLTHILWLLGMVMSRARRWTRWSLWAPSNSACSVTLWFSEPCFPGLMLCVAVTAWSPVLVLVVPSTHPVWGACGRVHFPGELGDCTCNTSALGDKTLSSLCRRLC